jgi:hypothetical protein
VEFVDEETMLFFFFLMSFTLLEAREFGLVIVLFWVTRLRLVFGGRGAEGSFVWQSFYCI